MFLKRYLNVSKPSSNSIARHITETEPILVILKELFPLSTNALTFSDDFSAIHLNFLNLLTNTTPLRIFEPIPSWFWFSKVIHELPSDPKYRKEICYEILDLNHNNWCNITEFHWKIVDSCICKLCGRKLQHVHKRYCKPGLAEDMKSCIAQTSTLLTSYPKIVNIMQQLRV